MRNNNEARNIGGIIQGESEIAYMNNDMTNPIAAANMSHSANMKFNASFAVDPTNRNSKPREFDGFADDGETITIVEVKNGKHTAFKKEVYIQQVITNAYAASIAFPTRTFKMVIIMRSYDNTVKQIVVAGKTASEVAAMYFGRCEMTQQVESRAAAYKAIDKAEHVMNFTEVADQRAIVAEVNEYMVAYKANKEANYK